jgi:hypothetical protein
MPVPDDIQESFLVQASSPGPLSYRWVFNPNTADVSLTHDEGPNIEVEYHDDLAAKIDHSEPVHGHAYRIFNGWRVLGIDHKPVEDPFVLKQVQKALRGGPKVSQTSKSIKESDGTHYGRISISRRSV